MIDKYVKISVKDTSLGSVYILNSNQSSISLGYPCSDPDKCTPYEVEVQRGYYLFECWGSAGNTWKAASKQYNSTPGYGGYVSGRLRVYQVTKFYVYIGNIGLFNAVKECSTTYYGLPPGGATDVRLNSSEKWWDMQSLISRIMVAAGGGGAEWRYSKGGNGGGIEGGESISGKDHEGKYGVYNETCPGAKQDSGSECPTYTSGIVDFQAATGVFGSAGNPSPYYYNDHLDYGGFGGGGYYGGSSYAYTFAGSGGSSFVSGHKGCNAVRNNTEKIEHTGEPYHYSGIIFNHTKIISGGDVMPLPESSGYGLHFGEGAFRITLLFKQQTICQSNLFFHHLRSFIMIFFIGKVK